jgi:hypothetical protein
LALRTAKITIIFYSVGSDIPGSAFMDFELDIKLRFFVLVMSGYARARDPIFGETPILIQILKSQSHWDIIE